ncbi:MAG TPA: hypothetical protein VJM11_00050 [Nevskiaceae bacterium]|nr:hypothetical protein [Nevskiaceae bacterium]
MAIDWKAHEALKDYEIAFENYRRVHELAYRGDASQQERLARTAEALEAAHAAWQLSIGRGHPRPT